jgi:hypothetical protein
VAVGSTHTDNAGGEPEREMPVYPLIQATGSQGEGNWRGKDKWCNKAHHLVNTAVSFSYWVILAPYSLKAKTVSGSIFK